MTEHDRAVLTTEVRKAVREEIRIELMLCGLSGVPAHWEMLDRSELAAKLREMAAKLEGKWE